MIKKLTLFLVLFVTSNAFSQINLDQNGVKSTVTNVLSADKAQTKRYEIANVGYNYYHWQTGGLIIIELFQEYYGTGYHKYIIENGYGQNSNSARAVLKLVESHGLVHEAIIKLGTPTNLATTLGDYINQQLPIYLDIKNYARYRAKITYLQQKVDVVTDINQIKINPNPVGVNIDPFETPLDLNTNLKITGAGNHYILNGNVGIGTDSPDELLTVKGKIHTKEVRVDLGFTPPDYVFESDYQLKSLHEVENYIKENKHLPEIPSAKEIEKNGLMLAEMNMSLLKKIEELTLYSIDQNKKIDAQAKEIETLKNVVTRVAEIEAKLKGK
ncbi:tail fiber protein [Flavobacterium hercynium]|uniref:Uncharacterized protein n=1 Tax=Flavobacterium hercynium TaxID=387094 RepID=A0A226HBS4_9FLAO|nr:tail fiber protein [Flavobacterium hercynium]OXA91091.1 hypothetical protein B0A66_11980 [Flavobacterium hercynium]SMP36657.1 hypothetical protein SAMN06265346_12344 [Flavobacterium hercynium]